MRLVSKLEKSDVSRLVLNFLGTAINKLAPLYDVLEISFSSKNSVRISDSSVFISLEKSRFFDEKDEKAIKAVVLKLVALAAVKRLGINIQFIEEILANRELIRDGFGDDLFYYYYLHLANSEKKADFEKFLEISIPWLSFSGFDESHSEFLSGLAKKFNYPKDFESLAKDFFGQVKKIKKTNLHAITKAYVSLVSKYNNDRQKAE